MRTLLLSFVFVPSILVGQAIFSENFDNLQPGDHIAASDTVHWRTWSGNIGTNEDAQVIDALSYSSPNCLAFFQQVAIPQGGPEDQVLLLGYHLWGSYVLSWNMYVPTERGAFLVLYHGEDIPSAEPAAAITFQPTSLPANSVRCDADGSQFTGYYYPRNAWFKVILAVDLDTRMASLWVNNHIVGTWDFDTMPNGSPSQNILGSLRFTSGSGNIFGIGQYYIDDVLFQEGTVGMDELAHPTALPLQLFPNPSAGQTTLSLGSPLQKGTLTVHDASGRVVLQRAWPAGASKCTLEAGALAPGAYLVRVASRASATAATATAFSGRLVVLP